MKKNYIAPAVEIQEIALENVIATSVEVDNTPMTGRTVAGTKDRGDYVPEDNTNFGNLW
ncbi:MAG: hypothetical protein IJV06_08070 [Bacteroidaceae bacterium]|nr:hypothetical protein [Bacteroidaceae bacterium]